MYKQNERRYINLVNEVVTHGYSSESRAGDTYSLPGQHLTLDLRCGFPLFTTRKIFTKGVWGELAAFVRGAEMLSTFEHYGCNYWRENAANWAPNKGRPETEWRVGRIYGVQWTKWRVSSRPQPIPKLREGLPATVLGIANGGGSGAEPSLRKVWNNMLQRCYNPKCEKYASYGGRGVYVVDRWLEFAAFAEDVKNLPGWDSKVGNQGKQLDKDTIGTGFAYGPDTTQWLLPKENHYGPKYEYTVEKNGQRYTFKNISEFCRQHKCEVSQFSRLVNSGKHRNTSNGFTLISKKLLAEAPYRHVNQLAELLANIKKDPYSRRHILTTWKPDELDDMALPPCHLICQFYVRMGYLNCHVYMRSVDLCVGLPSDVLLYATLMHLVAKDTGLMPGTLTFSFGDAHIYREHVEQWGHQQTREIFDAPRLVLSAEASTLTFEPQQADIFEYRHHPAIKYKFMA